jgi:hypothetical protein
MLVLVVFHILFALFEALGHIATGLLSAPALAALTALAIFLVLTRCHF